MEALLSELEKLSSSSPSSPRVTEILTTIKLESLTNPSSTPSLQRALELGCYACLRSGDLSGFERNVIQVKGCYAASPPTPATTTKRQTRGSQKSTSSSSTPDRDRDRDLILGLSLMHSLTSGNLSEFHSSLETLSPADLASPPIAFPVDLERWLMVGSYDRVLASSSSLPDPLFQTFMGGLVETVRESVAECCEVAYKEIGTEKAGEMMRLDGSKQVEEYVTTFRPDWLLSGNKIEFVTTEGGLSKEDVPSDLLISRTLAYANELERIV